MFQWINDTLHQPYRVLSICLGLAFISLVLEGSLFQLWSLHRDYKKISQKIETLKEKSENLDMKIQRVSDPNYLELEVRNQFDFVEEGDLVFVFADSK